MGHHQRGQTGVVSGLDLRALSIRRARHAAAREAILVRWRHLSAVRSLLRSCRPLVVSAAAAAVPKNTPRIPWSHELNWTKAIRGEAAASSPIEYAALLTETMLLGVVALRAWQGKKLLYDAARGQVSNFADANQYLTRDYRAGWAI